MANQNFGGFNRAGTITDQAAFDVGLRAHMVRVYNYMASGLALSGIVAYGLFSSPQLASLFFQVEGGFEAGDFVRLSLNFDTGDKLTLNMPVVPNSGYWEGLDGPAPPPAEESEETE